MFVLGVVGFAAGMELSKRAVRQVAVSITSQVCSSLRAAAEDVAIGLNQ